VVTSVPPGLEPGSPFGKSIGARGVSDAIGLVRLEVLLDEVFGLDISEGGLCNLLGRAGKPLAVETAVIAERVTAVRVVCSDETFDRVSSRYHWEMDVRDGVGPAPPDPVGPRPCRRSCSARSNPAVRLRHARQPTRPRRSRAGLPRPSSGATLNTAIDYDAAIGTAFKPLLLRGIGIGRRRDASKTPY
jgi:hypothetical protein